MNTLVLILILCCCSSSVSAVSFVMGIIPQTEPHFVKTYKLKDMKPSVVKIYQYSQSPKVKPIGYKFECEKIKPQLVNLKKDKAPGKILYGSGGRISGIQILDKYFDKGERTALAKCEPFL